MNRGELSTSQRMTIAEQVAGVLEAAHEKGVVHRDLKPQNVMITRGGETRVLDFGLAYSASAARGRRVTPLPGLLRRTTSPRPYSTPWTCGRLATWPSCVGPRRRT